MFEWRRLSWLSSLDLGRGGFKLSAVAFLLRSGKVSLHNQPFVQERRFIVLIGERQQRISLLIDATVGMVELGAPSDIGAAEAAGWKFENGKITGIHLCPAHSSMKWKR
jgi:hypothetical protein